TPSATRNNKLYKSNEIVQSTMKSSQARMKSSLRSDEIKSTHPPSRRISSPQGISSSKTIYSTHWVDLVEKRPSLSTWSFFWSG
ncbi:MAG: hypothetical protein IIX69_07495, partial [Clostridia bacterium]|nr:hypothetical protein [Clostridia bacterium]